MLLASVVHYVVFWKRLWGVAAWHLLMGWVGLWKMDPRPCLLTRRSYRWQNSVQTPSDRLQLNYRLSDTLVSFNATARGDLLLICSSSLSYLRLLIRLLILVNLISPKSRLNWLHFCYRLFMPTLFCLVFWAAKVDGSREKIPKRYLT